MNKLVNAQREQVETFRSIRDDVKQESKDQGKQLVKISQDMDHHTLKYQAYRQYLNLVITGLPENENLSTYAVVRDFFKNELKIKKPDIEAAFRLGQLSKENLTYIRPIIVNFARPSDRNVIWRKRSDIPQYEGKQRIKIQADIPRKLREGLPILHKIAKEASLTEQYKSAYVRDYALILDGKEYTAQQLEMLPPMLRPSSLATRKTDTALVFFSKFCELSNHFPSVFTYQDNTFYSMEQYLAFRRAELSQKEYYIKKALELRDPVEAKSILNALRKDHEDEWRKNRHDIAVLGIRAKFNQNPNLASYLCKTAGLQLGEASKNPCWGIGMTLEDQHTTNVQKWHPEGNLLGKILMQIRDELLQSLENPGN